MSDSFSLNKLCQTNMYIDDRYELISQISCTINAKIYKAYDQLKNKFVVIKIIKKNAFCHDEIRILSQINSQFIPEFIDYFDYGKNAVCIIMEFFDSITLKEKMKVRSLWSVSEQLLIFENILNAVIDIHKNDIIHNDLKPENIIYLRTGGIKIIDFGISSFSDKAVIINKLKGTPKYIAPEILNIKKFDKRSDIYSLGIILYELLTGVSPFENHNKSQIIKQQANNKYVPPININSEINKNLSDIILKALETNPNNRFQTVKDFLKALKNIMI